MALAEVARVMRASKAIHKVAKRLDRGKAKVPKGLAPLAPWERLSDAVVRISGLNPGLHTLQGTNVYLVGTGTKRILVDTGEGVPGFVEHLVEVMKLVGCEGLQSILLTHWHEDHVGGVADILAALAPAAIPVFKRRADRPEAFVYSDILDGQVFATERATLKALHTPGHTADHVSFIMEEDKAFISGDMILGCGTAVFDDFPSYMLSLKRARDVCRGVASVSASAEEKAGVSVAPPAALKRIYPGHGPVVEGAEARVSFYISHREERERQIVAALEAAAPIPLSTLEVTLKVYGLVPLPILTSAHYNVLHHIDKLLSEARVAHGPLPRTFRLLPHASKEKGS